MTTLFKKNFFLIVFLWIFLIWTLVRTNVLINQYQNESISMQMATDFFGRH